PAVRERVIDLLNLVGIPQPKTRADQYPHEFSGGMRQRAMIAMSIANDPDLLIADEPTTALDVTIQAQVLDVLQRIKERTKSAIVLITHDFGVVAGMADRVLVMYAGRPVETGIVDDIFYRSRHPYTLGLLASLPPDAPHPHIGAELDLSEDRTALAAADLPAIAQLAAAAGSDAQPTTGPDEEAGSNRPRLTRSEHQVADASSRRGDKILEVRDLVRDFPIRTSLLRRVHGHVHAVSGISFDVGHGETVALVGESGCGKSTTGRMVLRLLDATSGS